ncbi:hypothetical protein IWW50_004885 [Coemansia erecta]|nr:hypothetical protein IWW50_004885 [Coemansia erecta]
MAQAKRARHSSNGASSCIPPAIHGFELAEEKVIELPASIGAVTAMSAWPACESPNCTAGFNARTQSAVNDPPNAKCTVFAVGTNLGCIALVYSDESTAVLENSDSSAVLQLLAKDSSAPAAAGTETKPVPDVVAGDADGQVLVYVLGRVFSRNTLPAPISALSADLNPNTPSSFSVGDMGGTIASCHAQDTLWRAQLDVDSQAPPVVPNGADQRTAARSLDYAVNSTCSVWLPDKHGLLTSYVLVASARGFIQLLSRGMPIHTIPLPTPCNAMCPGIFTGSGVAGASLASSKTQAIIGDEAGRLLVLEDFELAPYAQVDYPITRVFSMPLRTFVEREGPDVVICATRSDTIYILHQRQVVATYSAAFWPAAIDIVAYFPGVGPALALVKSDAQADKDGSGSLHVISLRPLLDIVS